VISLKANEIRELSPDDVAKRMQEARQELFNLRFQHATGALENTSRLTLVKRELARLLTIQSEHADKLVEKQAEQQEGGAR
jgi:large subunit ribosomal protein L29